MDSTPLKIDLNSIIRNRLTGWKGKLIPGFMISALEKIIKQDELNETLRVTYPTEGTAFAEAVYKHFELTLKVNGEENIPSEGRFIFASNHPLGGLDGIGLIKVLGARYGDSGVKFLVNDMLMNVVPLRPVFLPVNKYGSQGRQAAKDIADAYASDMQIIIFPAGLVSRLHPDGKIRDLEWQKSFISKALEYNRDIIPVRFDGSNRMRFYRTAKWRKRLGFKVNIEQALLPSEVCAAKQGCFSITFGKPISVESLRRDVTRLGLRQVAANIKDLVYDL
ncbi:MAG: glycerol acyltransferase [Bacteroidales bacterium]|nr:glycerol acyltransferase [Bacteroidales bacterium]MBD5222952.1 glycerol acyltransferase [Bacteroidales bacterium]MBD5301563.1 glycerol acyltransferase [Bacteroides sp.]